MLIRSFCRYVTWAEAGDDLLGVSGHGRGAVLLEANDVASVAEIEVAGVVPFWQGDKVKEEDDSSNVFSVSRPVPPEIL